MEKTNWAGHVVYGAARFHEPRSLEELQEIVRGSQRIKALGSCHSFNSIADTDGDLVSMRSLQRPLKLDRERGTVTVAAGSTYGALCEPLHREGFALKNLAALPHVLPHWGKLTTMAPAAVQAHCPKLNEFRRLVAEYDPKGVFRNDYLNKYVFEEFV